MLVVPSALVPAAPAPADADDDIDDALTRAARGLDRAELAAASLSAPTMARSITVGGAAAPRPETSLCWRGFLLRVEGLPLPAPLPSRPLGPPSPRTARPVDEEPPPLLPQLALSLLLAPLSAEPLSMANAAAPEASSTVCASRDASM